MTCSITIWERLEPRPRANDVGPSLAAPVYDPAWFLARQWQVGEFQGRDAGSLAYVDHFFSRSGLPRFFVKNDPANNVDPAVPFERQTLAEPIEPDLSLQVELGQAFASILGKQALSTDAVSRLLGALLFKFGIRDLGPDDELNPIDPATRRFLAICVGRSIDGFALYQLAQDLAAGGTFPDGITTDSDERVKVTNALGDLLSHVQATFGTVAAPRDPDAWTSNRLEYDVKVIAVDPSGHGNATLKAVPSSKGEFDWYSLDVVAKDATAVEQPPESLQLTGTPASARFPGMPAPRFWYIEENKVAYVDVKPDPTDMIKLLVTDMMLVHGADWFLLPYDQALGTAVKTKGLVVTDVFGHRTLVSSAHQPTQPAGVDRFAMFAHTDDSAGLGQLADYFVVPPSPGPLAEDGATVEDVRFARDETADIGWAIERTTKSPIGEPRSGRERDAQIAAAQNLPPPTPGDPSASLRYQLESQVPANWIPLLGVLHSAGDPSIDFEKAAMLHPKEHGNGVGVVPSLGRILSPTDQPGPTPYHIVAEEVPRDGLTVSRTVSRSRWLDGTSHVWVSRRRVLGAGEAQSGLRFDSALPNQT
jgi:hypothetical protein